MIHNIGYYEGVTLNYGMHAVQQNIIDNKINVRLMKVLHNKKKSHKSIFSSQKYLLFYKNGSQKIKPGFTPHKLDESY